MFITKMTRILGPFTLMASTLYGQSALPSLTRAFSLPHTTETLYESADNEGSDIKVFYYIPKRTVFEKVQGQSVFSFVPSHDLSASVEFRLALAPSAVLTENYEASLESLTKMTGVPKENLRIMSMPLFTASTRVFAKSEDMSPLVVPPDHVPASGGLPFFFDLTPDGSKWFRKNLVERSLPLGVLEADVLFFDEWEKKTVRKPIKIPITLDEVPLCAVTASGCQVKW